MKSRTRFSRRFRRAKKEYIWACINVTHDLVQLNGSCDGLTIVNRDDWARDSAATQTIEKGAVVKRIIGNVRFSSDNGSGAPNPAGASYNFAIGKFDEDDSQVLDLATNFFGEDWMHCEAGSLDRNNATSVAFAPQVSWRHPIDIRVARKLTSDEEIRFVFGGYEGNGSSGGATSLLQADYFFRSLIQLP